MPEVGMMDMDQVIGQTSREKIRAIERFHIFVRPLSSRCLFGTPTDDTDEEDLDFFRGQAIVGVPGFRPEAL
jgi:hypothetical protein